VNYVNLVIVELYESGDLVSYLMILIDDDYLAYTFEMMNYICFAD